MRQRPALLPWFEGWLENSLHKKSPVDIGEKRNYNKDREKVSRERFASSFWVTEVAANCGDVGGYFLFLCCRARILQTSVPPSTINNRTCKSWSQVTYMATPPLQRGRKKYFTPLQKNDEEGANRPQFELTFSNFDYTTKSAAAQQETL